MDWYEDEVRQMEHAREGRPKPRCPVVFYGSSSIRLWTTLAEDLGETSVVNAGFGGSTLAACVHFFERLVAPLTPRSLVVYAGDNDIGDGVRPRDVLESFRQLFAKVETQLKPIPFTFLSIKVSPARYPLGRRIREANELVRQEISLHPGALFVDIASAMIGPDAKPLPELFLEDGLHLSPAGYKVWAATLRPLRNKIFTPDCTDINAPCGNLQQR